MLIHIYSTHNRIVVWLPRQMAIPLRSKPYRSIQWVATDEKSIKADPYITRFRLCGSDIRTRFGVDHGGMQRKVYKEAQKAATLKGMKWNDFRKAECGASTKPASTTATTSTKAKTATPTASKPTNAVFPSRVDPKYAKETLGKARMKTCVDQYNANKATNANGGLKWIVEGGGYWSECNKRLKG
jgi:hypothetical protein